MFAYKKINSEMIEEIKNLYKKELWGAYLKDDEKLVRAMNGSIYILGAFHGNRLVGMVRCVGDGEHIVLVQDLIIDPEYQRQGIGRTLLNEAMKRYSEVRTFMLLTDKDDEKANKFYQSLNLKRIEEMNMISYIR